MTKREIVKLAMTHQEVPYVPWNISLTIEARQKLVEHFGREDIESVLDNHFAGVANDIFRDIGNNCVEDWFGVIWDRSADKDIGIVKGQLLKNPTLAGYEFPDPVHPRLFSNIDRAIREHGDRFRIFDLGFSLFERAWTLRGMEDLLMDFHLNRNFVKDLLRAIADYNITQIREAVKYDIDSLRFGDDWGQQHGLIMGYPLWKEFIYPELKRMYAVGVEAGKFVCIHSCGDVDELFDDLIGIGLNSFNPFQPEVMDVHALLQQYHGRLCFHGGLSTQRTLPYGTPEEVKRECLALIEAGVPGGFIFAPAHAVEGDVPVENMLAMLDTLHAQEGFSAADSE
ncbi:MAG: uroporphyrinogen decarboxylase family protein [Victivallaceae bacterium]|nr:uroporphyrinogen decarboxylase family protein [Victivallaceae bacterium]